MIALAISAVIEYGLPQDATTVEIPINQAVCSGQVGEIAKEELWEKKLFAI